MAHARQSRPVLGLSFQAKVRRIVQVVRPSLGSGRRPAAKTIPAGLVDLTGLVNRPAADELFPAALEQRGNLLKGCEDLHLKDRTRIWS